MEPARPSTIRVLLVDDDRLPRESLATLLDADSDIEIVPSLSSLGELDDAGSDEDVVIVSRSQLVAALRGGAARVRTETAATFDRLTRREMQVLSAMTLGRTTRQICSDLGIGPNTVRTHVQHVIAKLHVHSRVEAVALALREQIV